MVLNGVALLHFEAIQSKLSSIVQEVTRTWKMPLVESQCQLDLIQDLELLDHSLAQPHPPVSLAHGAIQKGATLNRTLMHQLEGASGRWKSPVPRH